MRPQRYPRQTTRWTPLVSPPNSTRTAVICCASRSFSFATTTWRRTSSRKRCSPRLSAQSGLHRQVERQDVADGHSQAQDRRRDPPEAARSRSSRRRSTRRPTSTNSTRCSRTTARWEAPPADWGDPENALSQQQFFDVMEFCLEKLPPNTARVFMMREVMELDSDEICKELAITANNLWVILYRARMALRNASNRTGSRASRARRLRCGDPTQTSRHESHPQGHRPHPLLQGRDALRLPRAGHALVGVRALEARVHLEVCAQCTRFEQQLGFMREALRRYRQ